MKNIRIIFSVLLGVLVLASCEDSTGPVLSSNIEAPTITTSSGSSIVLNQDEVDDMITVLEWTKPDYGFDAAVTYTVEMDANDSGFSTFTELGESNTTSFSISVGDLNATLLGEGFTPLETIAADLRVRAEVSEDVETLYTQAVEVNMTPYSTCRYCPAVYVPGNYQAASGYTNDWSPADAPALQSVDGLSDSYEGYVYMANGGNEFKITANRDWSMDWGYDGSDPSTLYDGDGETNLPLAEAGYYRINVNLNNMDFSATNTDWGLIGDATAGGWDTDTNMSYDPEAKVWTLTTDLSAGLIKFRANDAWDLNYGDNEGDGTLEQGGSDISVSTAGNYTVTLDLSELPYTYSLTMN